MRSVLLAVWIGGVAMAQATAADTVHQWGRFEAALTAAKAHANPVQDVPLRVEFTGPGGAAHTVAGFWDGDRTWRVRFAPAAPGRWTFLTRCQEDAGLNGQRGEFSCVPYEGENPLYRHGPVRVSLDRWHLAHADGTPFFWLSDTAWNGALLASEADWKTYLADRAGKGFTAIQFVTTQWRAATGDADGRAAYTGKEQIAVNPAFFQRLDRYFDALNERGLVAAPVLLWAVGDARDPGSSLPEDQCIVLVRYMVARYGGHHCIHILGGDGNYGGKRAEKWQRIGRAVFGDKPAWPVTMHMCGQSWVAAEFRNEPWYAFHGYQSGHGDADRALRWLIEGPPSKDWRTEPHHPVINLEPNYEGHRGYENKSVFGAHEVRRAAYWSLLVSPTAGVTYGAHGIWPWMLKRGFPMNHQHAGEAPPWHEAMRLPGSTSMKHLRTFFASLEWWRLRPAPDMVTEQPAKDDPKRFVAAARAQDGTFAVVYMPTREDAVLRTEALKAPVVARWFDPREGKWTDAAPAATPSAAFRAPGDGDWVLWLGPKQ